MKIVAQVTLLSLVALQVSAYTLYNTQPYYVARPVSRNTQAQQCQSLPRPMLLLAERACGSPGALSEMPLVVVAQDSLQVVRDGQAQVRVAALNPQTPFATVTGPALTRSDVQAMRAVRVELRQPVYVSSLQSTIPFPDSFVVVHGADGAAAPLAIRTVLAPVPAGTVLSQAQPVAVSVLYALPLDPYSAALIPQQQYQRQPAYNYYATNYYGDAPLYQHGSADYLGSYGFEDQQQLLLPQRPPQRQPLPQQQFQVHFQPRPQYEVQQYPSQQYPGQQYPGQQYPGQQYPSQQVPNVQYQGVRPQSAQPGPLPVRPQAPQAVSADGSNKPGANLVTILEFPSSVATPESLFFQPEDPDSELGNRQPPQAVSPAGIVQSTQPLPNLSVFINSKESSVLQNLRDEAEKEKETRNRLVQAGLRVLQTQQSVNPELESVAVDAQQGIDRPSRSSGDAPKDAAKDAAKDAVKDVAVEEPKAAVESSDSKTQQ